jgi:hypothetical protein
VLDPLASGKPAPSQAVLLPPARAYLCPVARLHPPTSRRPSHLLPPSPAPTASLRRPGAGHGLHFSPLLATGRRRAACPYPQTATRRAAHPSPSSQAAQLAPPYRLRQQAHASRPPAASSGLSAPAQPSTGHHHSGRREETRREGEWIMVGERTTQE